MTCFLARCSPASPHPRALFPPVLPSLLQCPFACISQKLASYQLKPPNGDIGIDGLVSIFAHELAEATCDPQLRTWFDDQGNENADKCQYM